MTASVVTDRCPDCQRGWGSLGLLGRLLRGLLGCWFGWLRCLRFWIDLLGRWLGWLRELGGHKCLDLRLIFVADAVEELAAVDPWEFLDAPRASEDCDPIVLVVSEFWSD